MSFKTETREGLVIGHSFQTNEAYFFFGTKHFAKSMHGVYFPLYKFAYLKQVHGKSVVEADADKSIEADGHYTRQKGLALVSQTADCAPILLANETLVCAVHSGWRGSELNILGETKVIFASNPPLVAAIGPHILRDSFEVGEDVAKRLERAPGGSGLVGDHPVPTKNYFDLSTMLRRQLAEAYGNGLRVLEFLRDTVRDQQYHSFRRDGARAGRQYSFVVLNP